MEPKIGTVRTYKDDGAITLLYPGETATATSVEYAQNDDGSWDVRPVEWLVEPTPGVWGAWLRFRYRWLRWMWPCGKSDIRQAKIKEPPARWV